MLIQYAEDIACSVVFRQPWISFKGLFFSLPCQHNFDYQFNGCLCTRCRKDVKLTCSYSGSKSQHNSIMDWVQELELHLHSTSLNWIRLPACDTIHDHTLWTWLKWMRLISALHMCSNALKVFPKPIIHITSADSSWELLLSIATLSILYRYSQVQIQVIVLVRDHLHRRLTQKSKS